MCDNNSMTVQIAVRLPDSLVEDADQLIAQGVFQSRSELIRNGVEAVVRARRRQEIDLAYQFGYTRLPESASEMAESRALAKDAIDEEPWDRWW